MLSSLVRVHTPTGYCSGVLIDPYFILTARHFLRHRTAGDMFVFGDHWNRKVSGWIDLATTDISVLRLTRPVMEADHPTITPTPLPTAASLPPLTRGTPTISYGMGGGKPQQRSGSIWFKFPQVIGKNYHTRVRHALVIRQPNNPAIPGDSGGPVMVNNQLVGLQSLILDPYGKNLGVATISLINPHLGEIRAAMRRLPPHPGE